MTRVIASLVAAAGLSVSANAAVNTLIQMQVSNDGVNFSSSMFAQSGATFQVRVMVSYIGTASPVGLASFVFQPTVSNWLIGGDAALPFHNGGAGGNTNGGTISDGPGQYGRISPWARTALTTSTAITNHVHHGGQAGGTAGSGWLRIAQRQVTSWFGGTGNTTGGSGVPISQLSNVGRVPGVDPEFNSALTNIPVFRFGITLDAMSETRDALIIDAPLEGFGNRNAATGEREVYWWGSMSESTGSIRGTAIVEPATLWIPAPSSLALLALGSFVVARRRR
jgi:hypothetical protein